MAYLLTLCPVEVTLSNTEEPGDEGAEKKKQNKGEGVKSDKSF